MSEFFKKNKKKLIVAVIALLFGLYILKGIDDHSIIPDHIHSIDDKSPEEWTDEDYITVYMRDIQRDPTNVSVMIKLSEIYKRTGDTKAAKKMYEKILEIDPSLKEIKALLKELE
ncbi:MAG: tetratricopeptide repeat protein [Ignavibacteria bacterium]|nr:tetratricopeptide repeat protein [Ignavibacteria bacterium]